MKKFVFFSIPGIGHLNPTLNVARELVRLGNHVIYYSFEKYKKEIEKAGVTYRSYSYEGDYDGRVGRNIGILAKKLIDVTEKEISTLLAEIAIEKPDCIVHDALCIWGKMVASKLDLPAVSLLTTFAFNKRVTRAYLHLYVPMVAKMITKGHISIPAFIQYKILMTKYGLEGDVLGDFAINKEKLNIVFTSSYLQPYADSFDDSFKFVGPSLYLKDEDADFFKNIDVNKKLIYISMGTVYNDDLNFYKTCLEAFRDASYQVVLSLGQRFALSDFSSIPENIIVKNHIPQLKVLEKTDVFITHGGMNSINESLYCGVPMVLIPDMYEQKINAVRINQLGAGVNLKKSKVSVATLKSSVEYILKTKSYYTNAVIIQKTLRNAGGYREAAREVTHYLEK